jgi:hypothetical protein
LGVEGGRAVKLIVELVPEPCWGSNLRDRVSPEAWQSLRQQTSAEYKHCCGICGAAGRLNCHERWAYDDERHIQKLEGFIVLCDMCHHVKHIGLTGVLASKGKLNFQKVLDHYCQVNECTQEAFRAHEVAAWDLWRRRSAFKEWETDLGEWAALIPEGSLPTTKKLRLR